jgi:hypothetical protein
MGDEATATEPARMQTPRKKRKSSRIVLSCQELGFIFDAFVQKGIKTFRGQIASESMTFHDSLTLGPETVG